MSGTAIGRGVRYVKETDEEGRWDLGASGIRDWQTDGYLAFGLPARWGKTVQFTRSGFEIIGRVPRSTTQFAYDHGRLVKGDKAVGLSRTRRQRFVLRGPLYIISN